MAEIMPYQKELLKQRDSLVDELTYEYNKELLFGKKDKIISVYDIINQKFSGIKPSYDSFYSVIYNHTKDSLERCVTYIKKLKEADLGNVEKVLLSNELASAIAGIKTLNSIL